VVSILSGRTVSWREKGVNKRRAISEVFEDRAPFLPEVVEPELLRSHFPDDLTRRTVVHDKMDLH